MVGSVGPGLKGPEFHSCSILNFLREPADFKFVWSQHIEEKMEEKR